MNKFTLVIGASTNPERYSFLAINKLLEHQYTVAAIGNKTGVINDVVIEKDLLPFEKIHTVTLYISPTIQKDYYNYILSLQPHRIIFNPGTENEELLQMATHKGIECLNACTLVLLSTHQY